MKKFLFTILWALAFVSTASAQSMKVYQNGVLKAIYYVSKDDKVEFSDDFPFPEDGKEDDEQGGGGTNLSGKENGYDYVDLGLSVMWATCNVGANTPEGYGDYFAWGEVETKSEYNWKTYKWGNGVNSTPDDYGSAFTKYNTDPMYGAVDNLTALDPEDDVAHVKWGGRWRMPSEAEQDELRTKCTWTWTTVNGVQGYNVVGPNKNSIFLPAAGMRENTSSYGAGSRGCYWSSAILFAYVEYEPDDAFTIMFDSDEVYKEDGNREEGMSVRPVCPKAGTR